jgi:glycosyltransferase involved in cell wall biosynthesis
VIRFLKKPSINRSFKANYSRPTAMNILICTFSFPYQHKNIFDGRFVLSEAMAYAENGSNVRVITPHFEGAPKKERVHRNITVIRFQYFSPKSLQCLKKPGVPIYRPKSMLAILQIPLLCFFFMLNIVKMASWADIVHAQWTVTALIALPAKLILGTKLVLTARGSDVRLLPEWINRFLLRKVDGAIDCFGPIPWNIANKKKFPANYIKLPILVHNDSSGKMPGDMQKIIAHRTDAFILLYVGRFDNLKIHENKLPLVDLIHVCNHLKLKKFNFYLLYIGDGDLNIIAQMSKLINHYDLADWVTLLGPKNNVLEYIRHSHLGIGGIAMNGVSQEFTICAKPQILVATKDNNGTPWIHRVNAVFTKPDDQKDLASQLIWAISNPDLIKQIGEKAHRDMKAYIADSRSGGKLYLKQFKRLLDKNAAN